MLLLILVASRAWFAVSARQEVLYTPDEMELTLASVDRYLGVPVTNSHWPGMVNHMLTVPALGAAYVVENRGHANLSGFIRYLAGIYRNPWCALLLARLVVAVVFSLGITVLAGTLAARTGRRWMLFGAAVALATVPRLWLTSQTAIGNGIADGLMALAAALVLRKGGADDGTDLLGAEVSWVAAGGAGCLCGLALATRNTMVPFALFLAILLGSGRRDGLFRRVAVFVLAMGAALYLGCPLLWLEPIRWLKATLGNYRKPGPPRGLAGAWEAMMAALPLWLAVAGAASVLYGLVRRRLRALALAVLGCTVFMLGAAAPASFVESRYFESVILMAWIVVVLAVDQLARDMSHPGAKPRVRTAMAALVTCGLCAALLSDTVVWLNDYRTIVADSATTPLLAAAIERDAAHRVGVPSAWLYSVMRLQSREGLTMMLERATPRLLNGEASRLIWRPMA
jgi:hypothetical protein